MAQAKARDNTPSFADEFGTALAELDAAPLLHRQQEATQAWQAADQIPVQARLSEIAAHFSQRSLGITVFGSTEPCSRPAKLPDRPDD